MSEPKKSAFAVVSLGILGAYATALHLLEAPLPGRVPIATLG